MYDYYLLRESDLKMRFIQHPFTMMIAGPSGCGKTTFLVNLLKNLKLSSWKTIRWYNAVKEAIPKDVINNENITVYENMPQDFNDVEDNTLLVFDDLMTDAYTKEMCELFTKGCHHRKLTVILITQNVFHQGRFCRDIALNCRYLVMFKNPRDKSQILPLARQIYPEQPQELMRVYNEVTSAPHGYLLFDLTQNINELLRFRTNIFAGEGITCFCSKSQLGMYKNGDETFERQQTYIIDAKR